MAPKVSVAMITYNHGEFIGQAIESVLLQQTGFEVEVVIGEDCSTDATRSVVRKYAEQYPQKIRALLQPANVGMHRNEQSVRAACRGEYVAWLEGDDFWTDPAKLRKQARFLDEHPQCAICFHRVSLAQPGAAEPPPQFPAPRHRIAVQGVDALLQECFIPTCSVMYRRSAQPRFPEGLAAHAMGDWPNLILTALHGDIGYLDECMASYRVHAGGVWTRLSDTQRLMAEGRMLKWVSTQLPPGYGRIARQNGDAKIRSARRREVQQEILDSWSRNERAGCRQAIRAALRADPLILFWRPFFSLALRVLVAGR